MSKNNVWRELMERLKQKAEAYEDIAWKFPLVFEGWKRKEKWVRLEDVKEAIPQLRQSYILVERQKLLLIKGILEKTAFKRNVQELWVIPKKSKPYDNSPEGHYPACIVPELLIGKKLVMIMNEYYQELMKTLEELLKE